MIIFDYEACIGCQDCLKVCPRGVWEIDATGKKVEIANSRNCIDCTACEFQCPVRAIRIERALIPKQPLVIGRPQ